MKNILTYKYAKTIPELFQAYRVLLDLGTDYPNFEKWYWDKVVTSVLLNDDKVILAFYKNELVGVSIVKSSDEDKLRAIRISERFRNKGYGLYLIDHSLEVIGNDKPLCSVSEDNLKYFSRIFINRYDFDLTHVHKGIYMPRKLEYQFNGKKENIVKKSIYY